MKKSKFWQEIMGFLAVFSAIALTISFLVQAVRRKSLWQALLALLAAEGAVFTAAAVEGALDVFEDTECDTDCEEAELFDEQECQEAELRLHTSI